MISLIRRRFESSMELATALSISDVEEIGLLEEDEMVQLSLAISQTSFDEARDINTEIVEAVQLQEVLEASEQEVAQPVFLITDDQNTTRENIREEDAALNQNMTILAERIVTSGRAQEKLGAIYVNYCNVPTMFSEDHMWPPAAIYKQLVDLSIKRGSEDIVEWKEDKTESQRCLVCLTNVATRVAVPCGHRLCCRACISSLVSESVFYTVTTADGDIVPTDIRLPLQCPTCRAIIGLIVVVH